MYTKLVDFRNLKYYYSKCYTYKLYPSTKKTFCVGGNTIPLVTVAACMRLARHRSRYSAIVRCLMGLPNVAGTALVPASVINAVCNAMQGLRPLSHSGGSIHKVFNAYQLPCTEYQNTKILHRTLKVFHLNNHFIF